MQINPKQVARQLEIFFPERFLQGGKRKCQDKQGNIIINSNFVGFPATGEQRTGRLVGQEMLDIENQTIYGSKTAQKPLNTYLHSTSKPTNQAPITH